MVGSRWLAFIHRLRIEPSLPRALVVTAWSSCTLHEQAEDNIRTRTVAVSRHGSAARICYTTGRADVFREPAASCLRQPVRTVGDHCAFASAIIIIGEKQNIHDGITSMNGPTLAVDSH